MTDEFAVSAADLLRWAETLSGIARTGLGFTQSLYEQERFEEVLEGRGRHSRRRDRRSRSRRALRGVAEHGRRRCRGYVTPKVAVAAVVGNERGEILLTQRADSGWWLYPVGWADVGYSPSEIAMKEVLEETGIECEPVSLHRGARRAAPRVRAPADVLDRVPLPDARRRAAGPSARDERGRLLRARRAAAAARRRAPLARPRVPRDRRRSASRPGTTRRATRPGAGADATSSSCASSSATIETSPFDAFPRVADRVVVDEADCDRAGGRAPRSRRGELRRLEVVAVRGVALEAVPQLVSGRTSSPRRSACGSAVDRQLATTVSQRS